MDADRSHDPAEIGHLLEAADRADVVVGSRYVPGGRIENWPWSRRALSGGANALARIMVGREVRDWTAGFKCYRPRRAGLPRPRPHPLRGLLVPGRDPLPLPPRGVEDPGSPDHLRRSPARAHQDVAARGLPGDGDARCASPGGASPDEPAAAGAAAAPPRRWTPEAAVSALIAVTAAARVLIAWTTGLCFGESYYFSCALRPSLSYFDHPPLSILIASVSLALGGERQPPPAPRPVHRALRGHHLAPVPARAPALRRVGGVLGGAPAEPLADLHAERGPLLPARRARSCSSGSPARGASPTCSVGLASRAEPSGGGQPPAPCWASACSASTRRCS